jgi:DNA-binding LacI/PurR family transcriptional regulator
MNIKQIAKIAGVSKATASRVLNGSSLVKEETRQRVLAAIQNSGYTPSTVARLLGKRAKGVIGVIVDDAAPNGTPEAYLRNAVLTAILAAGRIPLLLCASSLNLETDKHRLRSLEGALLLGAPSPVIRELCQAHLPFLMVNSDHPDARYAVVSDLQLGAEMSAQYLWDNGCRKLAYIGASRNGQFGGGSLTKIEGLRRFLARQSEQDNLFVAQAPMEEGYGFAGAQELLCKTPLPDGLLVGDENVVIGVLLALVQRGCRIGEDMKLICYDDLHIARYATPSLSAIRIDFEEMARVAVTLLENVLRGHSAVEQKILVRPKLVIRESTGRT